MVLCSYKLIAGRTLFQAFQQIKNAALAVVKQQDAEIAAQILVPQGVLVIEKTQVANDTEDSLVCNTGEACCCGERALDTIHAPITIDIVAGIDVRQTDSSTICIVNSEK